MALDYDTSRAAVRLGHKQELIKAVHGAGDADESDWLEWKSTLDLTSAHGLFTVCRAVLGFSNRMPDKALRFAEGHAYVLVGAAPGQAPGVQEVDSVELNRGMEVYLGYDLGPLWQAEFVTVDLGAEPVKVLLIDVEPPRWGDPVHFLRKGHDKTKATTVYVRYPGRTEQASVADLDSLNARARSPIQSVRLLVAPATGVPIQPAQIGDEARKEWLRAETARCGASLRAAGALQDDPASTAASTAAQRAAALLGRDNAQALQQFMALRNQLSAVQAQVLGLTPDPRTADQYREEVAQYIAACSQALPRAAERGAAARMTPVIFEVHNTTQLNLSDVELVMHIPGQARAVHPGPVDADEADLPVRPRAFGTAQRNSALLSALASQGQYQPALGMHLLSVPRVSDPHRPLITNDASGTTITYPLGDLRPQYQVTCRGVIVVVPTPTEHVVEATWKATCRNHDSVVEGRLSLSVAGTPWSLDQLLDNEPGLDG